MNSNSLHCKIVDCLIVIFSIFHSLRHRFAIYLIINYVALSYFLFWLFFNTFNSTTAKRWNIEKHENYIHIYIVNSFPSSLIFIYYVLFHLYDRFTTIVNTSLIDGRVTILSNQRLTKNMLKNYRTVSSLLSFISKCCDKVAWTAITSMTFYSLMTSLNHLNFHTEHVLGDKV